MRDIHREFPPVERMKLFDLISRFVMARRYSGELKFNFQWLLEAESEYDAMVDPESDPLGAGYHILQAKIALGSGGVWGKGFLKGTQSHLSFLPEKHTDFVFTMLAEERGLIGGLALIGLYFLILIYGIAISLRVRNQFGRIVAMGVTFNFFLYVLINIAMVMGLIPVVGVPLPLISYGGTAMLTVMVGFGLMMSADLSRDVRIGRHGSEDF